MRNAFSVLKKQRCELFVAVLHQSMFEKDQLFFIAAILQDGVAMACGNTRYCSDSSAVPGRE